MKILNISRNLGIGLVISTISYAGSEGSISEHSSPYYFSVSGIGASTNSHSIEQYYAPLAEGESIPLLNKSSLSGGTGGVSAGIGYEKRLPNALTLQMNARYLFLEGQNKEVSPFYQTNVYKSAFFTQVNTQTITFNTGLNYQLHPKFSLYSEAGLGIAILSTYGSYATDVDILSLVQSRSKNQTNFSWQVGGGVLYNLTSNLQLDANIHYANFGDIDYGAYAPTSALPDGIHFKQQQFSAVLFGLGIKYFL
jgi:opacity protein-like surface antigen